MSLAALLVAVADHLTDTTSRIRLDQGLCEVMPDGMPPEEAVDLFVAIHPSQWSQTNEAGTALDETFGFQVTVSKRGRKGPMHEWGRWAMCEPRKGTKEGGLLPIAESVRAALHGNYTAITRANSMIDIAAAGQQTTANGFDPECIFFTGAGGIVKQRPTWWGSNTESLSEAGSPYAGLSITLNFKCRRVQDILSQT